MPRTKVLVVEDEEIIAEELTELLINHEYQASYVTSLAAAVEHLQQHPDTEVLLADVVMPDGNGLALLEFTRARERGRPAIIFVTGHASVGSASEAMRGGAFDYIEKPVHLDNLLDSVAKAATQVRESVTPSERRFDVTSRLENLYSLVIDLQYRLKSGLQAIGREPPVGTADLSQPDTGALVLERLNLYKRIIKIRGALLPEVEFSDPYWEILTLLLEAQLTNTLITITSVCYSVSGSNSAALRRIYDLEEQGMITRTPDEDDRRRVYLKLSDRAHYALCMLFSTNI